MVDLSQSLLRGSSCLPHLLQGLLGLLAILDEGEVLLLQLCEHADQLLGVHKEQLCVLIG